MTILTIGGPGRYNVKLDGTIQSNPDLALAACKWKFNGTMTIPSDPFDFDPGQPGRTPAGQLITDIVAAMQALFGVGHDFLVVFDGSRDVEEEGACD